ncbi:MAG: hypothetical protein JSS70_16965 [Bacteroidetes bacterium]|nr:hypothetical protein [Bacteroidota bacterium]
MKKYFVILFLAGFAGVSFSQKVTSSTLRFHSINMIGLIEGQKGSSLSIQSINGLQYKSLFGGIGIGLDLYRYRTIPVFIDLRNEFGKTRNKFFVFADAGMNFYWQKDGDEKLYYQNDAFKNGFYGAGGIGYKLTLDQHLSFLLSTEYSYKKLSESGSYIYIDAINSEKRIYNLNRVIIKAGIEF